MDSNPDCPVCGEKAWETFGTFNYTPDMNDARSDYEKSRMQVLFQLWALGARRIDLFAVFCRRCGYATYRPRPTEHDINVKYRFQTEINPRQGVNLNRDALRLDRKRAEKLFSRLAPFLPEGCLRVLDFGGGDGKLTVPFVRHGHECFLIDHNEYPLPGIRHLSRCLSELSSDTTFDLIISSHVLEHQAEPARILRRLRAHLKSNGLLYVEVPAEIFGRIPIDRDPVTHVGFFCHKSLAVLMEASGLDILKSRAQLATYNDRTIYVLWAVARKAKQPLSPRFQASVREVRRRLHPNFLERVGHDYHPLYLLGKIRQRFHYHHPFRKFVRRWERQIQEKMSLILGAWSSQSKV